MPACTARYPHRRAPAWLAAAGIVLTASCAIANAAQPRADDAQTYDLNAAWGHNFSGGHGNITLFADTVEKT